MPSASELFPQLLCRGCGKHGLSVEVARTHKRHTIRDEKGVRTVSGCRGGKSFNRDASCALCGESFDVLKESFVTGKMRKVRMRGRQIYEHKMKHIEAGDTTENFR